MTDLQRGFFMGEGAQLLCEIKQGDCNIRGALCQVVDMIYAEADRIEQGWEKGQKHYRNKTEYMESLAVVSEIGERTLYWYLQVKNKKPAIEEERAKGRVLNQKALRAICCTPKPPTKPAAGPVDDGWTEKDGVHSKGWLQFQWSAEDNGYPIFPIGGGFKDDDGYEDNVGFGDTIQEAKKLGDNLLAGPMFGQAQPPDKPSAPDPDDELPKPLFHIVAGPNAESEDKLEWEPKTNKPEGWNTHTAGPFRIEKKPSRYEADKNEPWTLTNRVTGKSERFATAKQAKDAAEEQWAGDWKPLPWTSSKDRDTLTAEPYRIVTITVHELWRNDIKLDTYPTLILAKDAAKKHSSEQSEPEPKEPWQEWEWERVGFAGRSLQHGDYLLKSGTGKWINHYDLMCGNEKLKGGNKVKEDELKEFAYEHAQQAAEKATPDEPKGDNEPPEFLTWTRKGKVWTSGPYTAQPSDHDETKKALPWMLTFPGEESPRVYQTLKQAKAAAQARFERSQAEDDLTHPGFPTLTEEVYPPQEPPAKPQTIKMFPGQEAIIEGPDNTEPEEDEENISILEDNGWKEVVEKRGGGLLKYKKGRWTAIWMPAGERWKLLTDTADNQGFERFFKTEREVVDFANSMYGQVVPALLGGEPVVQPPDYGAWKQQPWSDKGARWAAGDYSIIKPNVNGNVHELYHNGTQIGTHRDLTLAMIAAGEHKAEDAQEEPGNDLGITPEVIAAAQAPEPSLIDEAKKLQRLKREGKMTVPQLADEFGGGKQSYVRNRLKLLRLTDEEQKLVHEGKLGLEEANKIVDRRDAGEMETPNHQPFESEVKV